MAPIAAIVVASNTSASEEKKRDRRRRFGIRARAPLSDVRALQGMRRDKGSRGPVRAPEKHVGRLTNENMYPAGNVFGKNSFACSE